MTLKYKVYNFIIFTVTVRDSTIITINIKKGCILQALTSASRITGPLTLTYRRKT
jgi:hypothetical protein